MIRVLVVEDQKIMQKYFEYILLQDTEFRHVQTVADADTAVKICQNSAIDLVLMDVQTYHNHDGLKAGKAIKETCPYTKILIVTSLVDPKVLERAKSGCAGPGFPGYSGHIVELLVIGYSHYFFCLVVQHSGTPT